MQYWMGPNTLNATSSMWLHPRRLCKEKFYNAQMQGVVSAFILMHVFQEETTSYLNALSLCVHTQTHHLPFNLGEWRYNQVIIKCLCRAHQRIRAPTHRMQTSAGIIKPFLYATCQGLTLWPFLPLDLYDLSKRAERQRY